MAREKNSSVTTFYSKLFSSGFFVADEHGPYFQEKILQIIWNEQILIRNLQTEGGENLEVLHHGIWNVESGPDFHDGVVAVSEKIKHGDIEIHFNPEDWNNHYHQVNRDYNNVILHCVWNNRAGHKEYPRGIPLFNISRFLAVPIKQILSQVDLNTYSYSRKVPPSKQASRLSKLDNYNLTELLQSYGITRLLEKAHMYTQNIEKFGLDRAAFHALFDILGYKNNRRPFQKLASLISLEELSLYSEQESIAVLFGTAGLLPDPTQVSVRPEHLQWVHEMWSFWWTKRREYTPLKWNRHRLRPYNSPERRLLAGYYVIAGSAYRLGTLVTQAILEAQDPESCSNKLKKIFAISPEKNLLFFFTFSKSLDKPVNLLGSDRINDLVVNFAIPFFFASCLINNKPDKCLKGKEVLLRMPLLQDNRLLKEAVHYFLTPPSRAKDVITNACTQQGLLHLYKKGLQSFNTGSLS